MIMVGKMDYSKSLFVESLSATYVIKLQCTYFLVRSNPKDNLYPTTLNLLSKSDFHQLVASLLIAFSASLRRLFASQRIAISSLALRCLCLSSMTASILVGRRGGCDNWEDCHLSLSLIHGQTLLAPVAPGQTLPALWHRAHTDRIVPNVEISLWMAPEDLASCHQRLILVTIHLEGYAQGNDIIYCQNRNSLHNTSKRHKVYDWIPPHHWCSNHRKQALRWPTNLA